MEIVIIKNNDFAKDGKGVLFLSSNDYDLYAESFKNNFNKKEIQPKEEIEELEEPDFDDDEHDFPTCCDCDAPDICSDYSQCAIKAGIIEPRF